MQDVVGGAEEEPLVVDQVLGVSPQVGQLHDDEHDRHGEDEVGDRSPLRRRGPRCPQERQRTHGERQRGEQRRDPQRRLGDEEQSEDGERGDSDRPGDRDPAVIGIAPLARGQERRGEGGGRGKRQKQVVEPVAVTVVAQEEPGSEQSATCGETSGRRGGGRRGEDPLLAIADRQSGRQGDREGEQPRQRLGSLRGTADEDDQADDEDR